MRVGDSCQCRHSECCAVALERVLVVARTSGPPCCASRAERPRLLNTLPGPVEEPRGHVIEEPRDLRAESGGEDNGDDGDNVGMMGMVGQKKEEKG